jgi:hypothetical protein
LVSRATETLTLLQPERTSTGGLHIVRSLTSRVAGAATEGALISLLVIGLIAVPAFAAKGGGGGKPTGDTAGSGTIAAVFMDGATEGHYGARVTFDLSTSATPYPYVHIMCYQGSLVAEGRTGFFPTAMGDEWFYLGPTPNWQGGEAECTAKLEKYSRKGWSVLASTSFHVYE